MNGMRFFITNQVADGYVKQMTNPLIGLVAVIGLVSATKGRSFGRRNKRAK